MVYNLIINSSNNVSINNNLYKYNFPNSLNIPEDSVLLVLIIEPTCKIVPVVLKDIVIIVEFVALIVKLFNATG